MNAHARARVETLWGILRKSGLPGERYGEGEVARVLGVCRTTVVAWIERGWLTASKLRVSQGRGWYRIKRSALRRAINEYPQIAKAVFKAMGTQPDDQQGG